MVGGIDGWQKASPKINGHRHDGTAVAQCCAVSVHGHASRHRLVSNGGGVVCRAQRRIAHGDDEEEDNDDANHDDDIAGRRRWRRRRMSRMVACRAGVGGFGGGFGKKFEDSDVDYDDVIDVGGVDTSGSGNKSDTDKDTATAADASSSSLSDKLNIELKSRGVDPNLPKLAAPGLLNEMRNERAGPLGRLGLGGASSQMALALLASVLIW